MKFPCGCLARYGGVTIRCAQDFTLGTDEVTYHRLMDSYFPSEDKWERCLGVGCLHEKLPSISHCLEHAKYMLDTSIEFYNRVTLVKAVALEEKRRQGLVPTTTSPEETLHIDDLILLRNLVIGSLSKAKDTVSHLEYALKHAKETQLKLETALDELGRSVWLKLGMKLPKGKEPCLIK